MEREELRRLLTRLRRGETTVSAALDSLRNWPVESLPYAALDHQRGLRQGLPEVIFCEGKKTAQVAEIAERLFASGANLLATRASEEMYRAVLERIPRAEWSDEGRTITALQKRVPRPRGRVLVMTAGTSDIPVAEEAIETLRVAGSRFDRAYDSGVAGLHRLVRHGENLRRARVVIVVAGMDGALPSVIGGLVDKPIVAVPTSVGYGAGAGGITPLLTMLNSCAAGVAVVNIDNGFGAAVMAHRINLLGTRKK